MVIPVSVSLLLMAETVNSPCVIQVKPQDVFMGGPVSYHQKAMLHADACWDMLDQLVKQVAKYLFYSEDLT